MVHTSAVSRETQQLTGNGNFIIIVNRTIPTYLESRRCVSDQRPKHRSNYPMHCKWQLLKL